MKTKLIISSIFIVLGLQQNIQAQELNGKVQKSVVKIGESFSDIPMERLLYLDQIAFSMIKNIEKNENMDIIFIDTNNHGYSQLAMIWLKTGMIYYNHSNKFNIQSAGVKPELTPLTELKSLKEFGYGIKAYEEKNPNGYRIDYGTGKWEVFPKSVASLAPNNNNYLRIFLEKDLLTLKDTSNIELIISDPNDIARQMLYLSTRINNLLETKK